MTATDRNRGVVFYVTGAGLEKDTIQGHVPRPVAVVKRPLLQYCIVLTSNPSYRCEPLESEHDTYRYCTTCDRLDTPSMALSRASFEVMKLINEAQGDVFDSRLAGRSTSLANGTRHSCPSGLMAAGECFQTKPHMGPHAAFPRRPQHTLRRSNWLQRTRSPLTTCFVTNSQDSRPRMCQSPSLREESRERPSQETQLFSRVCNEQLRRGGWVLTGIILYSVLE
ncbi:hypothetical protein V8F33_003133 [Rhypophila sp. PSN 637]